MRFQPERLREAREKKGFTQRGLAQQCGINEYQLSRYETGRTEPSVNSLAQIAYYLDVSTDYLLGLIDYPYLLLRPGEASESESILLNTYRREGWSGVIRLGAERLSK
ncbi:MAG: helix-turn-helix domain-containing protein [Aggregatilineales bacterium]